MLEVRLEPLTTGFRRLVPGCVLLAAVVGCEAPPPAPEGLDDSVRYLFREFYNDDAMVGAGLTGLMTWFDDAGRDLLDFQEEEGATIDNADAFELADLEPSDIEHLPLPDDGRDLTLANGVVSMAVMDCDWTESEALLMRGDQSVVFDEEFDSYDRTYETSRQVYEDASASLDFADIDAALEPFTEGFELGDAERSMLLTRNEVVTTQIGVTIDYDLILHFRHGTYDVNGEPLEVMSIATFLPEPAPGQDDVNTFEQSYSVEINLDFEGGTTLRIFAVWAFIDTPWFDPDNPVFATTTVNASQKAAQRLSDICDGTISIPAE